MSINEFTRAVEQLLGVGEMVQYVLVGVGILGFLMLIALMAISGVKARQEKILEELEKLHRTNAEIKGILQGGKSYEFVEGNRRDG